MRFRLKKVRPWATNVTATGLFFFHQSGCLRSQDKFAIFFCFCSPLQRPVEHICQDWYIEPLVTFSMGHWSQSEYMAARVGKSRPQYLRRKMGMECPDTRTFSFVRGPSIMHDLHGRYVRKENIQKPHKLVTKRKRTCLAFFLFQPCRDRITSQSTGNTSLIILTRTPRVKVTRGSTLATLVIT
ncbi:hypothetical protein GGS20DRAFT_87554 [Poronia punctata]|nr:hypothetical protein GGS20DRAFT_87554 [Poronia punctata]